MANCWRGWFFWKANWDGWYGGNNDELRYKLWYYSLQKFDKHFSTQAITLCKKNATHCIYGRKNIMSALNCSSWCGSIMSSPRKVVIILLLITSRASHSFVSTFKCCHQYGKGELYTLYFLLCSNTDILLHYSMDHRGYGRLVLCDGCLTDTYICFATCLWPIFLCALQIVYSVHFSTWSLFCVHYFVKLMFWN